MKNTQITDIKKFERLLTKETTEAHKEYVLAKKAYLNIMKDFIKTNISGEKEFKKSYKNAFQEACECYEFERGSWAIDEQKTLDWMINQHRFWLEEGQFDEEVI